MVSCISHSPYKSGVAGLSPCRKVKLWSRLHMTSAVGVAINTTHTVRSCCHCGDIYFSVNFKLKNNGEKI